MKESKIAKKCFSALKNPSKILLFLAKFHMYDWMPDKLYLKFMYRLHIGKKLNLDNPQGFNEKLQWLKLYDRKPEYTMMVDKIAVRDYIAEKIGEEYLIPCLGVWDSPDDIDFDKLPNQFVLKCNHNSGLGMCICKDKSKLDIAKVKDNLSKGLAQNYYLSGREWPYKNVKPRIIAEQYMTDDNDEDLKDYKFMCFNGKVKCCFVCTERNETGKAKIIIYDKNWNLMEMGRDKIYHTVVPKPCNYDKMIEFAEKLAKDIPFVRIDFYEINGQLYFGEITFFPSSGFAKFTPESADELLGSWLKLT